jgi:predicted nuclease of predicted toxin-antitoxin system
MSLRIFADHCIPTSVIDSLQEAGHEVFRLRDHIPTDSPVSDVIKKTQELDSILLSLDKDFINTVSYPPEKYKGIISLRINNHPEIIPQICERMLKYFSAHPDMKHYNRETIYNKFP